MPHDITEAMVQQYASNITLLAQQKMSRLRRAVRTETIHAEFEYFDQIGPTEAQPKGGRNSDTPSMETPHYRRRVAASPYNWAELIDNTDKLRMLADPTSPYTMNAVMAFNRAQDRIIIDAFSADAHTGKEGGVAVPFAQKQILDIKLGSQGGNTAVGLTLDKLIETRKLFWQNEVDEGMPLYLACSAEQLTNLLNMTEVRSADYNSVKALVRGEVDSFMGFQFIRTELMPWANNIRDCYAWTPDGLLLAIAQDVKTKISERADKNYSTQVYVEMDMGATRMEELKVVKIPCAETIA